MPTLSQTDIAFLARLVNAVDTEQALPKEAVPSGLTNRLESMLKLRVHCLVFTDGRGARNIVLNSKCATESEAQTMLFDRKQNGEAFGDERYERLPAAIYDAFHHGLIGARL